MRKAFPFRYRIRTLLTLVTLVALFMACVRLIPGGSAAGSLANGRIVETYSDSLFLSSRFSTDTATIRTAGKTIVVEPTRLIVDGELIANIDKEVSKVEVRVERGVVTFVADGEHVQHRDRSNFSDSRSDTPSD